MKRPIIVCDDCRTWRCLMGVLLAPFGREIIIAPDGMSVMRLARERMPVLAVLDLQMPGDVQGDAIARALRETVPPTPVLLHSSVEETKLEEIAHRIGCEWRCKSPGGRGLREHVQLLVEGKP